MDNFIKLLDGLKDYVKYGVCAAGIYYAYKSIQEVTGLGREALYQHEQFSGSFDKTTGKIEVNLGANPETEMTPLSNRSNLADSSDKSKR
jgi:hypothetical protein